MGDPSHLVHLFYVHVVEVHGLGQPQSRSIHTSLRDANVAAATLRTGRDRSDVTIREVLTNPHWSEATRADRIATDINLAEFDEIVVGGDATATGECLLALLHDPAHLAQITQSLGTPAVALSENPPSGDNPLGLTTTRFTINQASARSITTMRALHRLFRAGILHAHASGEFATLTDTTAGSEIATYYSCAICLDVFEDLSCPNAKDWCIDCCPEPHP